jgi:hypothetical protein
MQKGILKPTLYHVGVVKSLWSSGKQADCIILGPRCLILFCSAEKEMSRTLLDGITCICVVGEEAILHPFVTWFFASNFRTRFYSRTLFEVEMVKEFFISIPQV